MATEAVERRSQIKNLFEAISKEDQARFKSFIHEPAGAIRDLISNRVKQMQELGISLSTEGAFDDDGEHRRIRGVAIKEYNKGDTERPFVSEDGMVYMCPDYTQDHFLVNWNKRREATDMEIIQHGTSILARLADRIDWHLNPADVYALGEGF